MDPAIPRAANPIQEEPSEKLQDMGTGDGWHFMPENRPEVLRECAAWLRNCKILNALGIEMNLAMFFAREAFQYFGKGALRSVPAVNKG